MESIKGDNQSTGSADTEARPSEDLVLPTIDVDDAFFEVLSWPSANMRPSLSRTHSDAGSSLGESSYDLISNSDLSGSGILSDDDARTESLASFDGNTPDDISLDNNGEDSDEEDILNTPLDSRVFGNQVPTTARNELSASQEVDVTPSLNSSGFSARTVCPVQESFHYTQFEGVRTGEESTHLNHTIHSIGAPDYVAELSEYGSPYVGVEMRMSISNSVPKPTWPFRVLIASYDARYDAEILTHIVSAITAVHTRSITTNDIISQRCREASTNYKQDVNLTIDRLHLTVRDGQVWKGKQQYPNWNLAVIVHDSLANVDPSDVIPMQATYGALRQAMESCNTPILDISTQHPLYNAAPHDYSCDGESLHLRITAKEKADSPAIERELLPVDLDQFLSIDPVSLGRHIVHITKNHKASSTEIDSTPENGSLIKKTWTSVTGRMESVKSRVGAAMPPWITSVRFEGLRTVFFLLVFSLILVHDFQPNYTQRTKQNAANTTAVIAPVQTPPPVVTSVDFVDHALSYLSTNWGMLSDSNTASTQLASIVSSATEQASVMPKVESAAKDRSLGVFRSRPPFEIHFTGPHSFLVTPKRRTLRANGLQPALVIEVHKDGKTLDSVTRPMNNGSYSIGVRKNQAHGTATVKIHNCLDTITKSIDIDFGDANKSPLASIRDLVAQEFILIQNEAYGLSTRMSTNLQVFVEQLDERLTNFEKRIVETEQVVLDRSVAKVRTQFEAAVQAAKDWHENTPWPVRVADWKPKTAFARGLNNTVGLGQTLMRAADWKSNPALARGLNNTARLGQTLMVVVMWAF